MADLGIFALLPASLAGYVTIVRPFVYMLYIAAGAARLRQENRDFSEAEAREIGRQQVINTLIDFCFLRVQALWVALPAIWLGIVHVATNLRLHADIWWRGQVRAYRRARDWIIACFRDKKLEEVRERQAQFAEAAIRRNELLATQPYDYEQILWDRDPIDKEHARARKEFEDYSRDPRAARGNGVRLELLIEALQGYGDNPFAVRRGGVVEPVTSMQGFAGLATVTAGASLVKTGLAWIAPRVTVLLVIVCVFSVWQWRRADTRADQLEIAQESVKRELTAAATALDRANVRIEDTARACIAQITEAADKAKAKQAADTAEKLRRQKRAQDKAAAGGAASVDGAQWMRELFEGPPASDRAPAADPNPATVPDGSGGPAGATAPPVVSGEPVAPAG